MPEYETVYPVMWLPDDWLVRSKELVETHATKVRTKGRGPGSLEPDDTAGLDYRVVTGSAIRDHAPWLWEWYTSDKMVGLVSALVGEKVEPSGNVESAININYLEGNAARYELHTDGQPYSAVLMCSQCDAESGGRLMLGGEGQTVEQVDTLPGLLVVFDGSTIPHAVEPIKAGRIESRMSMPMVYLPLGIGERPEGLDDYLYAER